MVKTRIDDQLIQKEYTKKNYIAEQDTEFLREVLSHTENCTESIFRLLFVVGGSQKERY